MKMNYLAISAATLGALALSSCDTPTGQGAGFGAATGAIIGAAATGDVRGAAIGAVSALPAERSSVPPSKRISVDITTGIRLAIIRMVTEPVRAGLLRSPYPPHNLVDVRGSSAWRAGSRSVDADASSADRSESKDTQSLGTGWSRALRAQPVLLRSSSTKRCASSLIGGVPASGGDNLRRGVFAWHRSPYAIRRSGRRRMIERIARILDDGASRVPDRYSRKGGKGPRSCYAHRSLHPRR